jgi:hypothetical protein
MIHRDDSMRRLRTQRSSHSSRAPPKHLDSMELQGLPIDTGSHRICSSPLPLLNRQAELVVTRRRYTTFLKGCSSPRERECNNIRCNTDLAINRKSLDSRLRNTHNMAETSCTQCSKKREHRRKPKLKRKHKLRHKHIHNISLNPNTTRSPNSDNSGLAHLRPNLSNHSQALNTTSQLPMLQPVRPPRSLLDRPLNIHNLDLLFQVCQPRRLTPVQCLIQRKLQPTMRTASNSSMRLSSDRISSSSTDNSKSNSSSSSSNSNSKARAWTKHSTNTRTTYAISSRARGMEIYEMYQKCYFKFRSTSLVMLNLWVSRRREGTVPGALC